MSHLHVGADPHHYLPIEVTTEYAWHALFGRALFIRPQVFNPNGKDLWQVVNAPGFTCVPKRDGTASDATVMINFSEHKVLLAGMRYAGEMKKSMFSVQNFLLPAVDVLPMHCSANVGDDRKRHVVLRTVRHRQDDAIGRPGTVPDRRRRTRLGQRHRVQSRGRLLRKVHQPDPRKRTGHLRRDPLRCDRRKRRRSIQRHVSRTTPTRASPKTAARVIRSKTSPLAIVANRGGEPNAIVFLTCDVSGVLPPVSVLSTEAAAYHFLSGYTAQVGFD